MTEEAKEQAEKKTEDVKAEETVAAEKPAAPKAEAKTAPKAASSSAEKTGKEKKSSKKSEAKQLFTGRRKKSVSRTRLVKGNGEITINGKQLTVYFSRKIDQMKVKQPLILLGVEKDYNVLVNVYGGGTTGQAEAVRMGIARSLQQNSPDYHKKLRAAGFLTRDSRMVERKKYGFHKARRASQFSKR